MAKANPSLFGMLGDEEALQRQLDEERAIADSKRTLGEQLSYMASKAGSQLGRGIAGAFGVDATDPEVRQKVMRSRIASQIDFNDPRSVEEGIRSLAQSGFVDDARTLSAALDESKKQRAEAEAKTAEKLTPDQRNARELATLKLKLDSLKGMDQTDPAVQQATANVQAQYDALSNLTSKADKLTSFGRTLVEAGIKEGSPEFQQLSKQFADATLKGAARGKGTDIIMPGQPVEAPDWFKFKDQLNKNDAYKKSTELVSVLPNALEVINMSTSNDIASAALPKALADIAGEGKQTSNADIARYAKTGGLDDRLIGSAVSFISGRTTVAKKEQATQFASAVYRGALMERRKALVSEARQAGYDKSPNYDRALQDIDAELAKFKKPSEMKSGSSPSKATGNPLIDKYLTK